MPKFQVHVRIGTDGDTIALTTNEMIDEDNRTASLDDVWSDDGQPFYDVTIDVDAPEPTGIVPVASVTISEPVPPKVDVQQT